MRHKGFTLIEMMVAVSVFAFVVAIVSGLFVYALRIQRSVLAQQELLDQTSYVVEYISRGLRMAQKDINMDCFTATNLNYKLTHNVSGDIGDGIKFLGITSEAEKECREFFLDTSARQLRESILSGPRAGTENVITSANMEVLSFKVRLDGELQTDTRQPRATVLLEVKRRGTRPEDTPVIRLQTTISQRNLDFPE